MIFSYRLFRLRLDGAVIEQYVRLISSGVISISNISLTIDIWFIWVLHLWSFLSLRSPCHFFQIRSRTFGLITLMPAIVARVVGHLALDNEAKSPVIRYSFSPTSQCDFSAFIANKDLWIKQSEKRKRKQPIPGWFWSKTAHLTMRIASLFWPTVTYYQPQSYAICQLRDELGSILCLIPARSLAAIGMTILNLGYPTHLSDSVFLTWHISPPAVALISA